MNVSPLAGKPSEASMLVNVPKLVAAYYTEVPNPSMPEQRVSFGTSGHRGSALKKAFNEWHILTYNRGRDSGLADGIVVMPSHNPPDNGGFKYNPPNGGPADKDITGWIEAKANELLGNDLKDVKRIAYDQALRAATTHRQRAGNLGCSRVTDRRSVGRTCARTRDRSRAFSGPLPHAA